MPAVWQGRVSGAGQCRSRCSPWSPQVLEALRIAVHGYRNSLMATTGCLRRFLDCRTRPGFHAAVQPCTVEWHPAGRLAWVGPISGVADARSVAECLRTAPEPRRSAALIVAYGFFTRSDGRRAYRQPAEVQLPGGLPSSCLLRSGGWLRTDDPCGRQEQHGTHKQVTENDDRSHRPARELDRPQGRITLIGSGANPVPA